MAIVTNSNMKRWMKKRGITHKDLAAVLEQTPANITQKVNCQVRWQYSDFVILRNLYGLSSDFVQDLVPYEALEQSDAGVAV